MAGVSHTRTVECRRRPAATRRNVSPTRRRETKPRRCSNSALSISPVSSTSRQSPAGVSQTASIPGPIAPLRARRHSSAAPAQTLRAATRRSQTGRSAISTATTASRSPAASAGKAQTGRAERISTVAANPFNHARLLRRLGRQPPGQQVLQFRIAALKQRFEARPLRGGSLTVAIVQVALKQQVQFPPPAAATPSQSGRPAQARRSSSLFLVSAMARAGLRSLGQASVQFMIVWQRYSRNGSSSWSRRSPAASSRLSSSHL